MTDSRTSESASDLRWLSGEVVTAHEAEICDRAADRIEQLEAALAWLGDQEPWLVAAAYKKFNLEQETPR